MTPYRISKDSGITQPTIHRILAGQPDVMASTLGRLETLCRAKGINPAAGNETKDGHNA